MSGNDDSPSATKIEHELLIQRAIDQLNSIGIFWTGGSTTYGQRICSEVKARMPEDRSFEFYEPEPNWEGVIFETGRFSFDPTKMPHDVIKRHNYTRDALSAKGVAWDDLPALPTGFTPLSIEEAYQDNDE